MEYVRSSKSRPTLPSGPFLVVGLARSGIAAATALKARGKAVFGVDAGEPGGLADLRGAGVDYATGTSGLERLDGVATVIKSPGVPSGAAVIAEAKERGLMVIGELELGWLLIDRPVIAITGTNGKTTTTGLATHLFREAGRPVAAAGNVGSPISGLAGRELDPGLTVVCECSSFQLEDTVRFSPEVAVHLNLSPDHLDRHGDFGFYERAKLNIFRNQEKGDVAILNAADPALVDLDPPGEADLVRFDPEDSGTATGPVATVEPAGPDRPPTPDAPAALIRSGDGILVDGMPLVGIDELRIRGRHNVANAMAAAAAALATGLEPDQVASGLRSFPPVVHRFEPIAVIEGVDFINDSKATNVEATAAALGSFDAGVHLILGGSGKGESFEGLLAPVAGSCRGIYLIGETADEIAESLSPARIPIVRFCEDLEDAVSEAAGAATPGETVLLSPACASFDQFRDFEDRGETFRRLVRDLDGD